MSKARTATVFEYQQYTFAVLILSFFTTAIFYAYLLDITVRNVVYVENNKKQMIELRARLSFLESEYLSESATLTIDKAKELGFVDAGNPIFVNKGGTPPQLSLNAVSR